VFLKVNKATINMLRRVEPYVAYGYIFFTDFNSCLAAYFDISFSEFLRTLDCKRNEGCEILLSVVLSELLLIKRRCTVMHYIQLVSIKQYYNR